MPNDYQIPLITERPDGTPGTLKTLDDGGLQFAGYEPNGGKMLVGTARDRFFENFATFDTSPTGDWEIVQTGPGMTITGPLGGAVAGSGPYLNIASGVTAASKTIILSRSTFSMPLDLRYQISASQRIANNHLLVGFVQVDDAGAIVTDTSRSTAPEVLNARNAVFHQHDGTTATTAQFRVRAAGSALDQVANAFGTGMTTVAIGTGPNFIAATTYGLMLERDKIHSRAFGMNANSNQGGQFPYDRLFVNPTHRYKFCVIVENDAVPASSTDWRLHLVNILDATSFDVSPRSAGTIDQSKAFPVIGTMTLLSGNVSMVNIAGTPAPPATPYILNSAATTNAALVLTGTSGLQALFASNTGAGAAYVKLYNKATAPTVGTDTPAMLIPVPAAVGGVPGIVQISPGFNGYRFALGLGLAITGGAADSDTTAVAADQVKVILSRTI
jgi:hypothetical protein